MNVKMAIIDWKEEISKGVYVSDLVIYLSIAVYWRFEDEICNFERIYGLLDRLLGKKVISSHS